MFAGSAPSVVPLRPLLGAELTAEGGELDWVVVDEVLRGHSVAMTWAEWDAVAGHLVALRQAYHGDASVKPGCWSVDTSPYREAVSVVASAFSESETEFLARLQRWWEARRRRERYAEKKRVKEEM